MKVRIEYIDENSLAPEEIKSNFRNLLGQGTRVTVGPDSDDSFSLIYFAIQELITARQVSSFHDDGPLYSVKLDAIRTEVEALCKEALEEVIADNENKLV